jgi:UDP-GlcNAc:undecaprenyl-phosphate/decaprenyl-phosphate GlcNAc-1-phosphate transferase
MIDLIPLSLSFMLALVLTPMVRALARRWGLIAKRQSDRWHTTPTALMGGVAFFVTVHIIYFSFGRPFPKSWVVLAGSAWLFVVGFIDDLVRIRPVHKLLGQILAALWVVHQDLILPWTEIDWLNGGLTIVWVIGITNALNLLDNMDGLAGGIAAIAGGFFAWRFWKNEQLEEALFYGIFAAALLGFLVYNFNPATIFMGDSGSMFIGFTLANAALLPGSKSPTSWDFWQIAAPILILSVPIFDTTLVTVLRKWNGRAVSQGGRDHSSHRLVALGLSERQAVFVLYGLGLVGGCLTLGFGKLEFGLNAFLTGLYGFVLVVFGWSLAKVPVYGKRAFE